ncbi:hypothetical protein D3C71_1468620 [compost metagenome]
MFNQLKGVGVGNARMFVINRFVIMLRQINVDLRPCAIDHHQTNAQAMQQPDIVDDVGKVLMFDGFPAKHDDKRLATVGVDIGN